MIRKVHTVFLFFCLLGLQVSAKAGSLYLPLQMAPEFEARIERLFTIANMPIIKRPIPVKQVHIALERAAEKDPALVSSLKSYLERYTYRAGVTHLAISGAVAEGSDHVLANQRGLTTESNYQGSYSAYWVLNDFIALNLGGVAGNREYPLKDEFAEGSFVSLGWDAMQLDLGYRPHWFSPFQESAMLISTQASALPGVTLSNTTPFSFLGIQYELFLAQMSESDLILSQARDERLSGNPRLFGMHLSFAPVEGFAIGFNRLMQYGGADRADGFGDLVDGFLNPKDADNIGREGRDFGNQLSAINTRYTFDGDFPISVYMEYAGEDSSKSSDYHLGNSALMFGLHMPKLTESLDLTYEYADWQNGWYTNSNYGDGLTHYNALLGHWAASDRQFGNAVATESQLIKLIWDISPGKSLTIKARTAENKQFTQVEYENAQEIELEYAQSLGEFIAGVNVISGSDAFGEDYSRISGFIRW
jgi:hypothetical protein